jgi:hypothetical protein
MTSYAYIHCKPDGTPFYVGKGVRSRYKDLINRNAYHKKVVAKYGKDNILIAKIDCSTNDNALSLEIGLIKCLRRMGIALTNLTDGGEGNVGWKCPDNVRLAVAEANRHRVLTDEQRYELGKSFRGKKRPEHSVLMQQRGYWAKEKNPFYGKGDSQRGANNHMARGVFGEYNNCTFAEWDTVQSCADDLGVTIQAVVQAIKKQNRSKGWNLGYIK